MYTAPSHSQGSPSDIRLVNGYRRPSAGRLEVQLIENGSWGTVCDISYLALNFQVSAARVACKQLGYTEPVRWGNYLYTDQPTNSIIAMTNVNCSSSASRLQNCSFLSVSSGCSPENIVGLECTNCSKYLCTNGQCVDAVRCNGKTECQDGSDENFIDCGESKTVFWVH